MVGFFQGFDQDFNANAVQRSWANGRVPMMTWETRPASTGNDQKYVAGYTNADITGGAFDAYLTKYADALKANGQPVVIRLDHEMNGSLVQLVGRHRAAERPGLVRRDVEARARRLPARGRERLRHLELVPDPHRRPGQPGLPDRRLHAGVLPGCRLRRLGRHERLLPQGRGSADLRHHLRPHARADPADRAGQADPAQRDRRDRDGSAASNGQKSQWIDSLFDALADPANADVIGFAYFSETATTIVDGVRTTNDWRLNSRADSLATFVAGIARTDTDYDLQEVKK